MAVTLVQQEFRFRLDTTAAQGGTPVWAAAQNTNVNLSQISAAQPFRIRFAIADTGTTSAATSVYTLRWARSSKGYGALEAWAKSMGAVQAFGIEGTGSYGAGLSRFLRERGPTVVEVNRPNRQLRYQQGKSDAVDASGPMGWLQTPPAQLRRWPRRWRGRCPSAPRRPPCGPYRRQTPGYGAEDGRCRFEPSLGERRPRWLPGSP